MRTQNPHNLNTFNPRLEAIEDRITPTPVVTATSLSDTARARTSDLNELRPRQTDESLEMIWGVFGPAVGNGPAFQVARGSEAIPPDAASRRATNSNDPTTPPFATPGNSNNSTLSTLSEPGSPDPVPLTPVVTVEATEDAAEPSTDGVFTLSRTGDTTATLTVNYTIGGTATAGDDYTALSGSVTFTASVATVVVAVSVLDDLLPESEETVAITITDAATYDPGTPNAATLVIADNEAKITLTAATTNIPVNANRTNNSAWRHLGGVEQVGLPLIRDFDLDQMRDLSGWNGIGSPPTGTAIVDPELKKLTASVAGGAAVGEIKVQVLYSDPVTGGRIRLWADQTKTTEIVLDGTGILGNGGGKYAGGNGTLPNYPTTEFYVEGTRPSRAADDITIRITSVQGANTVTTDQRLTVTPVIAEFSVNPKNPPLATFMTTGTGNIAGMTAGQQAAHGAEAGSGTRGVTYTADLRTAGIGGRGVFIQNVTGLTNGQPAGFTFGDGTAYNVQLAAGLTFPILDKALLAGTPFTDPFYQSDDFRNIVGPNPTRHNFTDTDTPFFGSPAWAGNFFGMNVTFQARMYLVWKYADDTLFTLAQADWQVVFHSTTLLVPLGTNIVLPDSLVTASPMLITNSDPAKIVGPMYNGNFVLVPVP